MELSSDVNTADVYSQDHVDLSQLNAGVLWSVLGRSASGLNESVHSVVQDLGAYTGDVAQRVNRPLMNEDLIQRMRAARAEFDALPDDKKQPQIELGRRHLETSCARGSIRCRTRHRSRAAELMSSDFTPPGDKPRGQLPPIKAPRDRFLGGRLLTKGEARAWARVRGRSTIVLPFLVGLTAVLGIIRDPAHQWFFLPVVIAEAIAIKILWRQSEEIFGGPGEAGGAIDPHDLRGQSLRRLLPLMKVILLIAAGFAYLVLAAHIAGLR